MATTAFTSVLGLLSWWLLVNQFVEADTDTSVRKIGRVRFLLTVNDTWADPPG